MKKTNKLISILLVLAMLLSMAPLSLTASAAGTPSYSTTSEGVRLYANGTNLFIEAGTASGTAVYYMNGSTKTYVNPNGAKGNDLSNSEIYMGTASSNDDYLDVSLVMTGGEVGTIYTAKSYGYLIGNVTVAVTGTAKAGLIWCGSKYGPDSGQDLHGKNGNLAIFNTVGAEIHSGSTDFDGMIKYSESGWEISGNAVIPEGVTMTVASGQTVTVPADAAVVNNGALVNNGTLELYGAVTGNNIAGSGTINCHTAYIENISSVSSISAKINGESVELLNGQYRILDGNLYIWLPDGNAQVTLNSVKYYGVVARGERVALTAAYTAPNDISGIPSEIIAYVSEPLSPKTNSTTFDADFTYEVLTSGTTAADAKMTGTSLYASGAGTIKLKITASDAYTSYSETFTVTVKDAGYAASVANGNIVISKHSDTQIKVTHAGFDGGYIIIGNDDVLLITGTSDAEKDYGITVESGTAKVIFKDVSITRVNKCDKPPVRMVSGTTLYLSLAGTNVLTDGRNTYGGSSTSDGETNAGLHVPEGATLIIDGEGALDVNGGNTSAGIGGGKSVAYGNITINGGTVTATGGTSGAGIGGGCYVAGGNITINGGTVTATGGHSGAGIGGGDNGAGGGNITINGGTVSAKGGHFSAGIGGGCYGAGGTITVNGGAVSAKGGSCSAGIGGGYYGAGENITINGGTVYATAEDGAGIGGGGAVYASNGVAGDGGTITVNGGIVTATSTYGAGIGGGGVDDLISEYDATAGAGGMITISGGTVVAQSTGSYGGAGIGSGGSRYGTGNSGGTVVITGGNIKATSNGGEAIGKGYNGTDSGTLKNADGNDLTLNTITLSGAAADTAVTKVEGINYGLTDVKTLDTDKLYFWLPADTAATSITAGENKYICNGNLTYYTAHSWANNDGVCANGCGYECPHENQTGETCEICGASLHTHSFTYSASGDTITAVCANTDGNCPDSEGTLTILAPADLYADGITAKEATIENNLVDTSVEISDITYSAPYGLPPKDAGTYTASVTVGGATASVQFELIKRSAAAENFVYTAPENLVYDGTAKYATVEVSPEITGLGEVTVKYYKDGEAVEPINAGTYTVKVSTADSDKYYAINDVELASFTISTKDISDAFIILGDALTYNGTEQTQTVAAVEIPADLDVTYTVSGNKATNVGVYLLTVTGTGNFTGEAKIAYEIAVDKSGIEGLTIENVKSTDKEKVEYVYNQLENTIKDLADEDKISEWNTLQSYCAAMRQRIEIVENQIEAFENKLGEYDINTVTSDDAAELESFQNSVGKFYNDYYDNLTDEQIKKVTDIYGAIEDLETRISDVAEEITRITNAVNGYDEATVKYGDYKDILQLIDDIEALTDGQNITADERASLEELNTKANLLAAKIRSTADEISRITRAVNAYSIDTVKSSDKADIENLIARIRKLTDGDNITADERANLNELDSTLDALLAKIDETADELARLEAEVGKYDEATVKSSDKTDLEQLKADIKALTDGQNITADERAKLENLDATADALLAKIAETKSEYNRVIAAANGYDEATVTSADKDALVQLNDDIYALALTDNVTAEEKENLQAAHNKVLGLLDKLTAISDEIKRIIEAVDKYVFESVKSSDKTDIEQLIADIKALLDTHNITADERTLLLSADETCTKLIEKIDETVAEISRINDATNAYDIDTVTSADKADIEKLLADIKALTDGDNITDTEMEQLNGNEATLNALLDKIGATADEIARIETAVNGYDEESVKSTDKADLEQLKADIKALTDATNITEDERTKLSELDATVDSLIKKIDDTAAEIERIDEAVNGYDKETVTSDDVPELGKLIEDIKALTDGDNLTEDERAALKEADKAIDELVEKLTEVAEEIKRVDEAVKSYDEETVKSTDSEDLAQLKEDIQNLIDSTNTTENEKTALEEMIKNIEGLEDKIAETEEKLEEIKDIENNFNPETVSSDDKAAIEETIAEIEAVNPDNLTDEQKAEYEEIKAGFEALLEEIAAAEKNVADIGVELEMFDEKRVTKFWEDDIEALKAKIDELLADENMGETEKAKLNEYKAQAEKLIEIINTPKEYFSLRFFYLIWDCLTWKYNGILWLFKQIFAF